MVQKYQTLTLSYFSPKKNQLWLWLAVDRDLREVVAFRVGSRGRKTLKKLLLLHPLRADAFATDDYRAYRILPQDRHVRSKAHTFTVESKNSQIRHYLARFHRPTKCYSNAVHMVIATLTIFFNRQMIHQLY